MHMTSCTDNLYSYNIENAYCNATMTSLNILYKMSKKTSFDFKGLWGLSKYDMIPMASILTILVEDHKRYKKKQADLKWD